MGVKALAVCHGEERTTFNEEAGLIVCVMGKDSKEFSTPVWKRTCGSCLQPVTAFLLTRIWEQDITRLYSLSSHRRAKPLVIICCEILSHNPRSEL